MKKASIILLVLTLMYSCTSEEDQLENALSSRNYSLLKNFKTEYPTSESIYKVDSLIYLVKFEEAKQNREIQLFQNYVDSFKSSYLIDSAYSYLYKIAWDSALQVNNNIAFTEYISNYPNSDFSKIAKQCLEVDKSNYPKNLDNAVDKNDLEQIIAILNVICVPEKDADKILDVCTSLFVEGHYETVKDICYLFIEKVDATEPEIYWILGNVYDRQDAYKKCIASIEKGNQYTDDPRYWNFAVSNLNMGHYNESFKYFSTYLQDDNDARQYLGMVNYANYVFNGIGEGPDSLWVNNNQLLNRAHISSQSGINTDVGLLGMYPPTEKGVYNEWIIFGDEDNPYYYTPNFFIWNGSVLQTPEYGTIISENTEFKYVKNIERGYRIVYEGKIKNWIAEVETTRDEHLVNEKWQ